MTIASQLLVSLSFGFLVALGLALFVLTAVHLLSGRPKPKISELTEQLLSSQKIAGPKRRLLRILLSTRVFRVESLWEQLPREAKDQLRRTDIPKKLRRLVQRSNKWHRMRAMLLLGLLEDQQAIGLLRKKALDSDQDLAIAAISALGRYHDESNARFLVGLLSERHPINSSRVASVLEGMRVNLAPMLIESLKHKDPQTTFWSATLLAHYPTEETRNVLTEIFDRSDANTKSAILDTLGKIGNDSTAHTLLKGLHDSVWYVRAHAALACGAMQLNASAAELIKLLADPVWWVRFDASLALANLLKTKAGETVKNKLFAEIDNTDPFCRNMVAAILSNHGSVDELVHELYHGNERRSSDARRLLAFIYRSGGAPQLKDDQQWQKYLASQNKKVFAQ